MPCTYTINGNQATTTSSNKTACGVTSIAGLRPQIYGFTVGADGAPNSTDCSIVYTLSLYTAAGTATAVTPSPTDIGFQAAKAAGISNSTIEPTYAGAILWGPMGLNQRASQQLWTPPNAPWTLVGTASNGAGMTVKSTNYGSQTDCILYEQE